MLSQQVPRSYQDGVFEKQCVVVEELKRQFGVYGIPAEVVSDNAKEYGFKHVISSPHYPKSNRQVERAIQTVTKSMAKEQ